MFKKILKKILYIREVRPEMTQCRIIQVNSKIKNGSNN